MTRRKTDKASTPTSPKSPKNPNQRTIGQLNGLIKHLGEKQDAYTKEENVIAKNAIALEACKAYDLALQITGKFYKGGSNEVDALKSKAREFYQFFKGDLSNRYPTLLLVEIPKTEQEQAKYEEDLRNGVKREYVTLESPKNKPDDKVFLSGTKKSPVSTPKSPVAVVKTTDAVEQTPVTVVKTTDPVEQTPVAVVKTTDPVEQTPVAVVKTTDPVAQTPVVNRVKEAEEQLKRTVDAKLAPIYKALEVLEGKLDNVDAKFRSPETKVAAKAIHADWVQAADAYKKDLLDAKGDVDAASKFEAALNDAMNKDGRKSLMDKDISWGDYFKDVFKMIANAAIRTVNVFKSNPYSFYQYAKPEASEAVEVADAAMRVN